MTYWEQRMTYSYYKKVVDLVNSLHKHSPLQSIIDIGCLNTLILNDIDIPDKTAHDRWRNPVYEAHVKTYTGVVREDAKYDVVTCICFKKDK